MISHSKNKREASEDRRSAIIAATLKCISTEGNDGLSVRKISKEAGISISLITYYYSTMEQLVAQAYEALHASLFDFLRGAVKEAGDDPRKQLSALIRAMFAQPILDPGTLKCWIVFWGMIDNSTKLREMHDISYGEYRSFVENILAKLADDRRMPFLDTRLSAISLLAIFDGLWIEWCLNQDTFTVDEAVRMCDAWVDTLIFRKPS